MLRKLSKLPGDLRASLFLFGLVVIFFYPVVFQAEIFVTKGLVENDLMRFNYPLRSLYGDRIAAGDLPFWTDLVGKGLPVYAEGQIGALFPLHLLLYGFLEPVVAFTALTVLAFFVAALSTYFFGVYGLGLSRDSSIFFAFVYALSGYLLLHLQQVNLIEVYGLLPLLLLAVTGLIKQISTRDFFASTGIVAMMFLVGNATSIYIVLSGVSVYLVVASLVRGLKLRDILRRFGLLVGVTVLAFLLTSFQTLPTLEMLGESTRSRGLSYEQILAPRVSSKWLLSLVVPSRLSFGCNIHSRIRFIWCF